MTDSRRYNSKSYIDQKTLLAYNKILSSKKWLNQLQDSAIFCYNGFRFFFYSTTLILLVISPFSVMTFTI